MKNFLKKFLVFSGILVFSTTITPIILHNNASAIPATQTLVDDGGGGKPSNNSSQPTTDTGTGGGSSSSSGSSTSQPTSSDCRYFLGLTSWDCGLDSNITKQEQLSKNIWLIAANILTDISVIAAYLVIGYVIYGGYLYMFSSGDVGKVSAGKKTLTHAFIGLAIVSLASIILGAIRIALVGRDHSLADCMGIATCINSAPETLITNLISWVIGIAGAVSVIFIVVGGVGYMTSSGDANKLQKAKNTITYALIGLAIVALSMVIVSFVSGIINNAK